MEEDNKILWVSSKLQEIMIDNKLTPDEACSLLIGLLVGITDAYHPDHWTAYNMLGDYFKNKAKDLEEK